MNKPSDLEKINQFIEEINAHKAKYSEYGMESAKSLAEHMSAVHNTLDNFKETFMEEYGITIEKSKSVMKEIAEVVKASTEEDVSRRKFEAVACKGRNKKGQR